MAVASQETLQTTKTIEVMVATTPPLMQDRKLPSSTYRYVHVRACLHTKHVVEVIRFHTETLEVDLRTSSLFFEGKQRIRCKIYIQIMHFFIDILILSFRI